MVTRPELVPWESGEPTRMTIAHDKPQAGGRGARRRDRRCCKSAAPHGAATPQRLGKVSIGLTMREAASHPDLRNVYLPEVSSPPNDQRWQMSCHRTSPEELQNRHEAKISRSRAGARGRRGKSWLGASAKHAPPQGHASSRAQACQQSHPCSARLRRRGRTGVDKN